VAENLEVGGKPARTLLDGTEALRWMPSALRTISKSGRRAEPSGRTDERRRAANAHSSPYANGQSVRVLLDEPSGGVAAVIVEQMAQMILALKAKGASILLSEQDLHFAELVADRAYVLDKGQMKYEGTTRELAADEVVRKSYLSV